MKCLICKIDIEDFSEFKKHLQYNHKISQSLYCIEYFLNGITPICNLDDCNNQPRYNRDLFTFKKYCKDHGKLAMSEGGKIGGKAPSPLKGQTKETSEVLAKKSEDYMGENNHFYGKHHSKETIEKLKKDHRISEEEYNQRTRERSDCFETITTYSEYWSRIDQQLELKCVKCDHLQTSSLQTLERCRRCDKCDPYNSMPEKYLDEYIQSLGFKTIVNSNKIISPFQIDIFVEDLNVGFEYHGLNWHMDKNGIVDPKNHRKKFELTKNKGIKLIQFFSDSWLSNPEIVKSMISAKLGRFERQIGARQCSFEVLDPIESKLFFDNNHISGYSKCFWVGALKYENEYVCMVSLRKSFSKKYKGSIEICRFATALNTKIMGGFSKILKEIKRFCVENKYNSLITYSDLMYGEGLTYSETGFTFISESKINYEYTDGNKRYSRQKYRAQDGKSEEEVAKEAGVYKIFGAGNYLYEMKL